MLAFRRPVLEVGKILRRKEVNGAIQETAGVEIAKALQDWLAYVAGERPARTGWNKAASWARKNAALYAMGFKLSTMLAQMTGLLAATSEIGLKWTLRGVADTYGRGNPFEAYRAVTALSPMMRHRIASVDRDVFEASSKLMDTGSTRRALDPFVRMKSFMETKGFVPMGVIQMAFADLPTWNGAYAKALTENGGDIEAAARYADAVVERTQVGGAEKDLAAVQRGSELGKLMTMFYSYFSALYNLSARRVAMLHRRRDAASVYRLGTLMLLTWFAEPVLMGTLLGKAPDDEGDDWEDWLSWGAKEAFFNPWRVQARLLLRAGIQEACPGAGQSCLPGRMAGVSEGAAEAGRRKTLRQGEAGGRARKAGSAAERAPGSGHGASCHAWDFHAEHCPPLPERTGAGRKNGFTGQAVSSRKAGAAPALQALAWQAQSAPRQSLAFPQAYLSRRGGQKARVSQGRQTGLAVCRLPGNGQKAFP